MALATDRPAIAFVKVNLFLNRQPVNAPATVLRDAIAVPTRALAFNEVSAPALYCFKLSEVHSTHQRLAFGTKQSLCRALD